MNLFFVGVVVVQRVRYILYIKTCIILSYILWRAAKVLSYCVWFFGLIFCFASHAACNHAMTNLTIYTYVCMDAFYLLNSMRSSANVLSAVVAVTVAAATHPLDSYKLDTLLLLCI